MSEPMDNIKKWAEDMKEYDPVPWDMLPQIYLYMDQVITYMEGHTSLLKRRTAQSC